MKQTTYDKEKQFLSRYATFSEQTKGRRFAEEPCPLRTDFQRDRDRILHSKAFRRLKNKTQVFLAPTGDHYRTRLTHTLDVAQIARSISRALNLNEDLAEAIALGHDLGHTPFGHTGERTLAKLSNGYFKHNEQSLRVVDVLEKDGEGLNLTYEVRDGILNHRSGGAAETLEGRVVMFSDKIAYINHDIDDAKRAGLLTDKMLPKECLLRLGKTSRERINNMILSVYENSLNQPFIRMGEDVFEALNVTRKFLFENVYTDAAGNREDKKADRLLTYLFEYYSEHSDQMPDFYREMLKTTSKEIVLCDFIASMTDTYAINLFSELCLPRRWDVL